MLASLLPGLRDVRAPFVSGSLVLASLYLLFGQRAGAVTSGRGRTENLDDLVSWLGRPGLAAATSLAAYLVGSLVVTVVRTLLKRVNEHAIDRVADRVDQENQSDVPTTTTVWNGLLLGEVFRSGPRRLRLASSDLHADFDRLISESELRDGLVISLPLTTAALLANVELTGWTKAALASFSAALVVVLFAQARRSDREAHSLLMGAVADHTVSTHTLDAVTWAG